MRRLLCILVGVVPLGPAAAVAQADYQVPTGNPYTGVAGAAPEVYAYGLRNPYRFSFDRLTGDVLIGDVGGSQREEVDWASPAGVRGANFGWACREGTVAGPRLDECPVPGAIEPLFDYPTDSPDAVTGGFVVRDPALAGLVGRYLYADHFSGAIHSLALDFEAPDDTPTGATVPTLASFGEDADGRLYAASLNGNQVVRLVTNGHGALATQALGGTFAGPVAIGTFPDDATRLFVAEQGGKVRLVANGSALPTPYLDVVPFGLSTNGNERGLLSVVAAPDYASTGKLYIYYTDAGGDIRVDEVTRSATNPDVADPLTRRNVITIEHSQSANHNGGQLHFGPDGCLWVTTGDGGGQNNQFNNAQNLGTRLGKILRIDPDPPGVGGPVCGGQGAAGGVGTAAGPLTGGPGIPSGGVPPASGAAVRVAIRSPQPVLRRGGAVLRFRCLVPPDARLTADARCRVRATGRLQIGRRSYPMKPVRRRVRPGQRARLEVALRPRARRALRRALRNGKSPRVRIVLESRDALGKLAAPVRRFVLVGSPPPARPSIAAGGKPCGGLRAQIEPLRRVARLGVVRASVRCQQPARVTLRGELDAGAETHPLERVVTAVAAAGRTRIDVPLTDAGRDALRQALRTDRPAQVLVRMRAYSSDS